MKISHAMCGVYMATTVGDDIDYEDSLGHYTSHTSIGLPVKYLGLVCGYTALFPDNPR